MSDEIETSQITLKKNEREAMHKLSKIVKKPMNPEKIQEQFFVTAREFEIAIPRFFKIFYNQVLGIDRGPRAGNLVEIIGRNKVAKILEKV